MKKFQPILSSIVQVFSPELLRKLAQYVTIPQAEAAINYGADRVVSLRNRDTSVKTQWNGVCSSFATIAAIENSLGGAIDLSERSLWDYYGIYSTNEAIKTAQAHWILEEKYWPQAQPRFDTRYKGKGRYQLTLDTDLGTDPLRVMAAMDNGHPCIVAISTPNDLYRGFRQVEAGTGFLRHSGHALCISGYKVEGGKAYFLAKNSWGPDKGDGGYQYVAFELFNHEVNHYAYYWEVMSVADRGEQSFDVFHQENEMHAMLHEGLL